MAVLKTADTGKPSTFVGMKGIGKPVDINWNLDDDEDEDDSWKQQEAEVEV